MNTIELSEVIKNTDMYELACKTNAKIKFTDDEAAVVASLNEHFKEVGRTGCDANHEISSFVQKVINQTISNTPSELLDELFERGTIGEYDDFENVIAPKNALVSYEAAKGGNVARSYLDTTVLSPRTVNRQIETDISYADLERNGWKTVATITEYAMAEFQNAMFADIFASINDAIASGAENYLSLSGALPTQAEMDKIALYVSDRAEGGNGTVVALSKYIQAISKLTGFDSDAMKDEVHLNGRLGVYDGVSLFPVNGAKKLGNGNPLLQDKRIFGIAGKLGVLNMRGDVKVYQDMNNNTEKVHLMFKNFTYAWAFNDNVLENVIMAVAQ